MKHPGDTRNTLTLDKILRVEFPWVEARFALHYLYCMLSQRTEIGGRHIAVPALRRSSAQFDR